MAHENIDKKGGISPQQNLKKIITKEPEEITIQEYFYSMSCTQKNQEFELP